MMYLASAYILANCSGVRMGCDIGLYPPPKTRINKCLSGNNQKALLEINFSIIQNLGTVMSTTLIAAKTAKGIMTITIPRPAVTPRRARPITKIAIKMK